MSLAKRSAETVPRALETIMSGELALKLRRETLYLNSLERERLSEARTATDFSRDAP